MHTWGSPCAVCARGLHSPSAQALSPIPASPGRTRPFCMKGILGWERGRFWKPSDGPAPAWGERGVCPERDPSGAPTYLGLVEGNCQVAGGDRVRGDHIPGRAPGHCPQPQGLATLGVPRVAAPHHHGCGPSHTGSFTGVSSPVTLPLAPCPRLAGAEGAPGGAGQPGLARAQSPPTQLGAPWSDWCGCRWGFLCSGDTVPSWQHLLGLPPHGPEWSPLLRHLPPKSRSVSRVRSRLCGNLGQALLSRG